MKLRGRALRKNEHGAATDDKKAKFVPGITTEVRELKYAGFRKPLQEIGMSVSIASSTRPRHPGLPTDQLFKLFRAAIKDDGDTGDPVIKLVCDDIVSYDHERARHVMELIVRRHPMAWSALYALLEEARDARSSIAGLRSEYCEEHTLH